PQASIPSLFTPTPTTQIYTLSLHDALPIYRGAGKHQYRHGPDPSVPAWRKTVSSVSSRGVQHTEPCKSEQSECADSDVGSFGLRSEEHTSELQSQSNLVCRLLLEKKNQVQQ